MALRLVTCACGHPAMLQVSAVNRASRAGAPIYCTRECAGIARRLKNPPTEAERKAAKAEYDAIYRADPTRRARKKALNRARHLATYDPVKAAAERKAKMPRHVEYCRRPEYRAWKSQYDRRHRASKEFGEFWESALLILDLQTEVLSRASRYEIDLQSGTINKKQQRRRDYDAAQRG